MPNVSSAKIVSFESEMLGHVSISYRRYFYNERETEDREQREDD